MALSTYTLYVFIIYCIQTWKQEIVYKWKANQIASVLHCPEYSAKGVEEVEQI